MHDPACGAQAPSPVGDAERADGLGAWLSMSSLLSISWENFLLCQLGTQARFSTTCATCFQAHLATAGRVLAMDAGCGLSTRGQWRGPVTCNAWEGELGQCQPPYTTLMCRFVPTFNLTFMSFIAIMYQELISLIVHKKKMYNSS